MNHESLLTFDVSNSVSSNGSSMNSINGGSGGAQRSRGWF